MTWWAVTPNAAQIERNRQALAELTRLSRELRMERAWERRADEEWRQQGREARLDVLARAQAEREAQAEKEAQAAQARVHAEAQAERRRIEARAEAGRRAIQRAWDTWYTAPDWGKERAAVEFWDVVETHKRAVLLPLMLERPRSRAHRETPPHTPAFVSSV